MKPIWSGSSFGLERVTLKLIDAYDSSKGIELAMVNGVLIGYGDATYYGGGKLGSTFDGVPKLLNTPVTNPLACFSGAEQADLRFKYNTENSNFTVELLSKSGNYDYALKSNCGISDGENPFSIGNENLEVYLVVEFSTGSWDSGFIFESIAGSKFSVDEEDHIDVDNDGDWVWGNKITD
jgi:hypothetical protein